jgi:beta-phosphoglucomutase
VKKAVLFDLDGVLLGSMPYHVKAWQEVFSQYNIQLDPNEIYSREGTRTADLARNLAIDHKLNLSEEELQNLVQSKSKKYNEITQADVMPGVSDLVLELKRRQLKIAIVTSTFRENLLRVMPQDLVAKFDTIITGGYVENGKPHPEPFLKAAEKLGIKPSECIVVENAEIGIRSGKAAEMFCVGVTSTQTEEQLKQADKIVPDIILMLDQIDEILSV